MMVNWRLDVLMYDKFMPCRWHDLTLGKISFEGRNTLFISANYSTRIPNL
jgi:hypothetical protein